jgi:NADH dehydrogenase [ubiquinone] 1 alpha subcomplex assembly factor 7
MTTPLEAIIAEAIASDGPMPLSRYMALALGHPRHGYYAKRDPLGMAGDFITAPEISQMFGELVGLWAAHAYERSGNPARVSLVELGPGRGTLMRDALRVIGRAAPAFRTALTLHLVETSPALRAKQGETLADHDPTWHDSIATLPDGPVIVIANEFFDALPIRQFVRSAGGWHERVVGLEGGRLTFGLAPSSVAAQGLPPAPEGAVLEVCEEAAAVMGSLARRVTREGGAALVIDYGHIESSFGETFQAVRAHKPVDPLAEPGEADLTAHVDFAALARAAAADGASIDILTTQASFLEAVGIRERAEVLKRSATPAQVTDIEGALARLTDRSAAGMGSLFKVLAIGPGREGP